LLTLILTYQRDIPKSIIREGNPCRCSCPEKGSYPSVTYTNFPEFDRDAGENLIAESSDR